MSKPTKLECPNCHEDKPYLLSFHENHDTGTTQVTLCISCGWFKNSKHFRSKTPDIPAKIVIKPNPRHVKGKKPTIHVDYSHDREMYSVKIEGSIVEASNTKSLAILLEGYSNEGHPVKFAPHAFPVLVPLIMEENNA